MNFTSYRVLIIAFVTSVVMSCKQQSIQLQKVKTNQIAIDSSITNHSEIEGVILPFRKHLNEQLDTPLCFSKENFTKNDGQLESSLGNLMADISFKQTGSIIDKRYKEKIDFVLFNHGGIRAPIAKGNVTARNAFEVMPFENELVAVKLHPNQVMKLFEYLVKRASPHPVSNLEMIIDKDRQEAIDVKIGKVPFDPKKEYIVLTTDYLQQGGDQMDFFREPKKILKTDYKLRNALIDYFKKVDTIIPQLDQRIKYAK